MFFWELKREWKNTYIHVALYSAVIIIVVLFVQLLDEKGLLAQMLTKQIRQMPEMVVNAFLFLKSEVMSSAMKGYLCTMLLLFLPVLYYAMMLPIHAFEKEEDYGTIVYLCSGSMTRTRIFWSKCLVSFFNYSVSVIIWCMVSALVLWFSYETAEQHIILMQQLIRIWSSLLLIGYVLIAFGHLYAVLKNKDAVGENFAFNLLMLLTLIRLIPFVLSYISSIMFKFGYNVQYISSLTDKVTGIIHWMVIFWCNPIVSYVEFIQWQVGIFCMIISAAMLILAHYRYQYREFGT